MYINHFKRLLDIIMALLLMLPFAIILLVVALIIKKDGGSLFFSHPRVGKHYKPFKCFKFRTMVQNPDMVLENYLNNNPDAKQEWQETQKLKDDPRVTGIGCFLRKYSLDELPQLINVLRGDMSMVGPRPITEAELERYGEYADTYASVKPGLTGLWQVSGRNDISYDERVLLDAQYTRNINFLSDVKIILKTAGVVLRSEGCY